MDIIKIDADRALDLLEQCVVERGPDYVYRPYERACHYVEDADGVGIVNAGPTESLPDGAKPSCMIGLALHKAGVPLEVMPYYGSAPLLIGGLIDRRIASVSVMARRMLSVAQAVQDRRQTWGEALAAARLVLDRHGDSDEV